MKKWKQKTASGILLTVIAGAVGYLLFFAPFGSLGSLDGQSLEVDRWTVIFYILAPLGIGLWLIARQGNGKDK